MSGTYARKWIKWRFSVIFFLFRLTSNLLLYAIFLNWANTWRALQSNRSTKSAIFWANTIYHGFVLEINLNTYTKIPIQNRLRDILKFRAIFHTVNGMLLLSWNEQKWTHVWSLIFHRFLHLKINFGQNLLFLAFP